MRQAIFHIPYKPPFSLELTAWVLRRNRVNVMDQWDGRAYSRVLALGGQAISVEVTRPLERRNKLKVTLRGERLGEPVRRQAAEMVTKVLGLGIDLRPAMRRIRRAAKDRNLPHFERLDALARRFAGLRPPRFPSVFEAILNGISCQQISLLVGLTLLGRLCRRLGIELEGRHAFPRPEDLAGAHVSDLRRLGYSGRKAEYILNVARLVADGQLDLESLAAMDNQHALAALMELAGVGRWTGEYVLLRGLGRLDVFPADDLGAAGKLRSWLGVRRKLDYEFIHRLLRAWNGLAGMMYFYTLLNHLAEEGFVRVAQPPSAVPSAAGRSTAGGGCAT